MSYRLPDDSRRWTCRSRRAPRPGTRRPFSRPNNRSPRRAELTPIPGIGGNAATIAVPSDPLVSLNHRAALVAGWGRMSTLVRAFQQQTNVVAVRLADIDAPALAPLLTSLYARGREAYP